MGINFIDFAKLLFLKDEQEVSSYTSTTITLKLEVVMSEVFMIESGLVLLFCGINLGCYLILKETNVGSETRQVENHCPHSHVPMNGVAATRSALHLRCTGNLSVLRFVSLDLFTCHRFWNIGVLVLLPSTFC